MLESFPSDLGRYDVEIECVRKLCCGQNLTYYDLQALAQAVFVEYLCHGNGYTPSKLTETQLTIWEDILSGTGEKQVVVELLNATRSSMIQDAVAYAGRMLTQRSNDNPYNDIHDEVAVKLRRAYVYDQFSTLISSGELRLSGEDV